VDVDETIWNIMNGIFFGLEQRQAADSCEYVYETLSLSLFFFLYGSTTLYGPGPPRFVEVSWSHTFETHHSR
jgi:hypothetical protein